jgi:hypothetical protein
MLNDDQIQPYLLELREVCDAAAVQLLNLREAAADWVRERRASAANRASAVGNQAAIAALGRAVGRQTTAFDSADAFLMNWARASYLVHPVSTRDPFTKERGETMRSKLKITGPFLDDRDLRNSWVHFDERLDEAMKTGRFRYRHRFSMARDVTPAIIEGALRLLEMDTLVMHYHLQNGQPAQANIMVLGSALNVVHMAANVAWTELQPPVSAS